MPRLIYLIGPPGVGKSTTMKLATDRWRAVPAGRPVLGGPFIPHELLVDDGGVVRAVEMGSRREPFGGTDALSMSIGAAAIAWIASKPADLVLGEGQRLATKPFLANASLHYEITLVCLSVPDEVLAARWASRGTEQSASWRKGAATRVRNIAAWAESGAVQRVVGIDASGPPGFVADEVRALL